MPKKLIRTIGIIWTSVKYFLLAAVLAFIVILILLSGAYRDLKNATVKGLAGKIDLTAAAAAAQTQNWPSALDSANQAQQNFSSALDDLNRTHSNPAVKNISLVRRQINDLEYLLKTAEILSRSLGHILPIAQNLDKIRTGAGSKNFSDLPSKDKIRFLQLIYQSEPELNGLKANLDLALLNLDKTHRLGVLWPIYGQISSIKQELGQTVALMTRLSPLIKLLPVLSGYPEASHFLLILQNNDELRPTGGFIGVYGILESRDGEIISLKTDDSYHLDMPASLTGAWKLEPPAPIKKYLKVEKWYLRDANWSPDWPTSAKKIVEIFNGESQAIKQPAPSFTGLFAITPDLVADLIRLVGPITVKNTTYDANNFQPLLQYNVEIAYKDQNISSWDRKDIINELVTELKSRLLNLPAGRWGELFKILDQNITAKNIQIYFANPAWEDLSRTLATSGEVKMSAGDFLMVVNANLGAFKSDAVVKKDLTYTVTGDKGGVSAALRLNYRHEGGFDWRTTTYRSYTRIYAPLGSRLISLIGLDETTADISAVDDPALNKTVFGFFFMVKPGTSQEMTLNYRLPAVIDQQLRAGNYQLLIQKQAGQKIESLNVLIKPLKGKVRQWNTDLDSDKNFSF